MVIVHCLILNFQLFQRLNRLFHSDSCRHRKIHLRLIPVTFKQTENPHVIIGYRKGGKRLQIPTRLRQFLFAQSYRRRIDVGFRTLREKPCSKVQYIIIFSRTHRIATCYGKEFIQMKSALFSTA